MADFNIADKIRQKNEGLYANNPADSGGETYAGIARNYWPNWKGWKIIDDIKHEHGKSAAAINKYASTDATLRGYELEFYKTNFWYALNLQDIQDQQIANAVYDFGVNAGIAAAGKCLQRACNAVCGLLVIDGSVGAKTTAQANKLDAKSVYDAFNEERRQFYNGIVAKNPSQKVFLKTWLSRIKPYSA